MATGFAAESDLEKLGDKFLVTYCRCYLIYNFCYCVQGTRQKLGEFYGVQFNLIQCVNATCKSKQKAYSIHYQSYLYYSSFFRSR